MTRLTPEQIAEIKARHSYEELERCPKGYERAWYNGAHGDRATLLSHIESDGWQTMETAPRDTTEIIGMDAKGRVYRTWFFAPSSQTRNWLRCDNNSRWNPTHWRPLPAPPETKE